MKTFWRLYKKDIRSLAGPGIGLILLLNIGGLLNAVNYVSSSFYMKNLLYIFRPVSVTPGSTVILMYTVLFLYAALHQHLKSSKYQDFILPCRRSHQLAALFSAVATWVTAIPVAAVLLDVMYGTIHNLFPSLQRLAGMNLGSLDFPGPYVYTNSFYTIGDIASMLSLQIIYGLLLCSFIMMAYIVTIVMYRIPNISLFTAVFTGIATIIFEYIFGVIYIPKLMKFLSSLSDPISFMSFPLMFLILMSVLIFPSLFLYERYGEV